MTPTFVETPKGERAICGIPLGQDHGPDVLWLHIELGNGWFKAFPIDAFAVDGLIAALSTARDAAKNLTGESETETLALINRVKAQ